MFFFLKREGWELHSSKSFVAQREKNEYYTMPLPYQIVRFAFDFNSNYFLSSSNNIFSAKEQNNNCWLNWLNIKLYSVPQINC